ncbi:MAG: hypothetical protein NTX25_07575 [Proteobacteria bacterium]|nr:hypothetical protein [Pseudomonadota bacterium]
MTAYKRFQTVLWLVFFQAFNFLSLTISQPVNAQNILPPESYESWSACEKQDYLWNNGVLATHYKNEAGTSDPASGEPRPALAPVDFLGLLLGIMHVKTDVESDFAPFGWKKVLHRRAVVAKVKFVADPDSPFTGIFAGSPCGLLRASLTSAPGDDKYNPGIAWKALVDQQISHNVSALVSLEGQGQNFNFFANEFSNVVHPSDKITLKIAAKIFRRASRHPQKLSVRSFAQVDSKGLKVVNALSPVRLFFVGDSSVQMPSLPVRDFRDDFAKIPAGSVIFNVYAVQETDADSVTADDVDLNFDDPSYRARAVKVGSLISTSVFVASSFGDEGLFFRHERFRGE